ncbi:MAG: amidohydrolase/deacetylase family metallohydrolase, partial [Mesorhizobium sp.]
VHLYCVDGPAFDILVCMSKLLALGMPLIEVLRAATQRPAEAIARPDLGTLRVGAVGDVSVLRQRSGRFTFVDAVGASLVAEQRLVADGIVIGGAWWPNEAVDDRAIERFEGHARHTHVDVAGKHFGHNHE